MHSGGSGGVDVGGIWLIIPRDAFPAGHCPDYDPVTTRVRPGSSDLLSTSPCPLAGRSHFTGVSMSTERIEIYDTTLRDGTQGEGFNLSLQDKLLIAQRLDELGVDYIEGGFPLSNPKDV